MLSLTTDVVQYDCPYTDVTDDVHVPFYTVHWDFDAAWQELETRILVEGADGALSALETHDDSRAEARNGAVVRERAHGVAGVLASLYTWPSSAEAVAHA